MFIYSLVYKFLIFVEFCLCYLLYNRYTLSCILLKLRIKYNSKISIN